MNEQPDASVQNEDEVRVLDVLVVLAENARLLIFGSLLVGLAALGYAFTIIPTFTASTTILPPQQEQSTAALLASQFSALAGVAGLGGVDLKSTSELYISLVKSRTVADRIVDRFSLMQLYRAKLRREARQTLEAATKVTVSKEGLITIEVDDEDPKRAADMANAYVEELAQLTAGLAITDAQQRRIFFEKQLGAAHENLTKAQLALSGVGVPENLLKSSPGAVVEGIARLQALVMAQEIRVSTMRGHLTERSPGYRLAQRELDSLREQLKQSERDQPAGGAPHSEYLSRFRDFKYQETLFDLLAKQYEAARLDEARDGAVVQVVDKALPPEFRSRPKRAQIAVITTLATGVLLALAVFVREALRNARNVPESASKLARIAAGLRGLVSRPRK